MAQNWGARWRTRPLDCFLNATLMRLARAAAVGARTVWRWLQDPQFQTAYPKGPPRRVFAMHRAIAAGLFGSSHNSVTGNLAGGTTALDAMNIRLLRKIERLESSASQTRGPEPHDAVISAALASLSTADLELLVGALEAQSLGMELSPEQVSAGERFRSVVEAECLQAGYKSLAEFERICQTTMSTTSLRRVGQAHWR